MDAGGVVPGRDPQAGVVSAWQALSSETSIERLHARVVEVLGAMTGATAVQLLLWSQERQDWLLLVPDGDGGAIPASGPGRERAVPMSVLRCAQQMHEPLIVADAARDDRFARDPYFAGAGCCSLLAVPISSRGALRAVLLLENRLRRDAFTAGRLDAVNLIADQLAVSLDNAQTRVELRGFAEQQAALRRVATLVARGVQPEQVFTAVTDEAGLLLKVDYTVLSRYDPDGLVTVVGHWSSTDPGRPLAIGLRLKAEGQNIHAQVFQTGRPARIDDYDVASGAFADVARDWQFRASVGVPIQVEGRLWGVMSVGSRSEPLPADTETRLSGFTELVATAVADAQARAELHDYAEEQAALRRVAVLVARAAPPEEVFAAISAEAGRLLGADFTGMSRYHPDGTNSIVGVWARTGSAASVPVGTRFAPGGQNAATLIFQTGQPVRIDDAREATGPSAEAARGLGARAWVSVPITVEGRLWGSVAMASSRGPLPAGAEARLAGFTELAGTAIANAESQAALTASRARIVAAADTARRRIERDLHDGAQQRLVTLALQLRAAQAEAPPEAGELAEQLEGAVTEVNDVLEELREIARGLHPALLAQSGLRPALRALARRSAIPVSVQVQVAGRLPEPVEVAAYYAVAEALTNAAKHARASVAAVEVAAGGDTLRVCVRDDGCGGADFGDGSGLIGLRDRVEALGGRIFLDSPPGAGTSVRVELPLTATNAGGP
jgi:signal transduction histidine kinase